MNRIDRLMNETDGQSVLISHPDHVFYFTRHQPTAPTFLVLSAKHKVLVGPDCEMGDISGFDYAGYNDAMKGTDLLYNICKTVGSVLAQHGTQTLYLEKEHIPTYLLNEVQCRSIQALDAILLSLRRHKDADEVRRMRMNQSINEQVFQAIPYWLEEGRTTGEVQQRISQLFQLLTDGTALVDGCFGAGVQSDNPDAQAGDVVLQQGDHLFVDLYPRICGYYADLTRVYSIGAISAKQRDVFSTLEESLLSVESALGPGISCNHIDEVVQNCIRKHGYEGYFPHHTGHGLGIAQQEPPFITRESTDVLQPGDVIAIEPGIYIPGWGGMRLESTYRILQNGVERFDAYTRGTVIPSVFDE